MSFWIAAIALFAAVVALMVMAVRRGGPPPSGSAPDIAIYRAQLAEVERDLTRGILEPDEAARARAEIARRLLDVDRAASATRPPRGAGLVMGTLIVVALPAVAFWLYPRLGAPSAPDAPLATRLEAASTLRAARPTQAAMEATAPAPLIAAGDPAYQDLLIKLRAAIALRPDDLRGQELLARNEAAIGNFPAAARAQGAVMRLKGDRAGAEDYSMLADLLIAAAGGSVSAEAERALMAALRRNPRDQMAMLQTGRLLLQTGRPDLAFRFWRDLLEDSPSGSPWVASLRAELPQLAYLAGVDYTLPPEASGPNADDVAGAAAMTPEDRQAMVRGMVDRLSERLGREGGPSSDWARLITSLGVLGDDERAKAIWTEAQSVFATRPDDLERVRAAARTIGAAP